MEPLPDSALFVNCVIFAAGLICCSILSFLETSITALRVFKLKEMAQTTNRYSSLFEVLEKDPNRVLNTILVGMNLADVTATASGTLIMESVFRDLPGSIGFSLGVFLISAILLVFGEIVPKNIAKSHGDRFFSSALWITNLLFYGLYPLVSFIMKVADFIVVRIFGEQTEHVEAVTSEKEIRFLIDYINERGLMEEEKTSMLRSIFELGTTPVREIMVPSTSIISLEASTTIKNAYSLFTKYQFSRFPVYEGSVDNIIGMLHFKDLFIHLTHDDNRPVKELVRQILFIPESVKVNQLLKEFKMQHMHIAMVIDEFGGIVGLVTLEDVLEEIVGEIHDEYESVTEKAIPLKRGGWLVDASIELEKLSPLLALTFEREEALTLGGFLTEQLQRLPKKGDRLVYKGYVFLVQQANSKRIFQVLIFSENEAQNIDNLEEAGE